MTPADHEFDAVPTKSGRASDVPDTASFIDIVTTIERLDGDVRAFLPEADRLGRLARDGITSGALEGVPLGIKDVYRVAGLPTHAGSLLPADLFAGAESTLVTRLRAAGAVIAGKTAMDEFAYCEPPPTRNPRDPRRTPGGSSGGSAAAVAAGMCPLAVGSQTLQSVIVPAAFCGVLGYKPTYQRLPFDGIPLAPSFDTIGLLGASIPLLRRAAEQVIPGWRDISRRDAPVLGVPRPWGAGRRHEEGWAAFGRHTSKLRAAGFDLRDAELPWTRDLRTWAHLIGDLLHGEMATVHATWYDRHAALYRPRTAAAVERGRSVAAERLAECRDARDALIAQLNRGTEELGIDCWICPSTGTVAPTGYNNTGDSWLTSFWSYAGWPQLTIPIFDGPDGLPHGLQLIGPAGTDEQLLTWADGISAAYVTG